MGTRPATGSECDHPWLGDSRCGSDGNTNAVAGPAPEIPMRVVVTSSGLSNRPGVAPAYVMFARHRPTVIVEPKARANRACRNPLRLTWCCNPEQHPIRPVGAIGDHIHAVVDAIAHIHIKRPGSPNRFRFAVNGGGSHDERIVWEYASVSTITPKSRLPSSWRFIRENPTNSRAHDLRWSSKVPELVPS